MKNLLKPLMILAVMTLSVPSISGVTPGITIPTTAVDPAAATALTNRLAEIQAMDKTKLTAPEKRSLRKEVRSIKKVQDNGGVFLSVGAIIIIVLLLILLL